MLSCSLVWGASGFSTLKLKAIASSLSLNSKFFTFFMEIVFGVDMLLSCSSSLFISNKTILSFDSILLDNNLISFIFEIYELLLK